MHRFVAVFEGTSAPSWRLILGSVELCYARFWGEADGLRSSEGRFELILTILGQPNTLVVSMAHLTGCCLFTTYGDREM